jgi:hypothetical protein
VKQRALGDHLPLVELRAADRLEDGDRRPRGASVADVELVKATITPGWCTLVGITTPSRIVCRAVERVRMIVHCAGGRFAAQVGETIGDLVWPSSIVSAAALGASAASAQAAIVAATAEILMWALNTRGWR